MRKKEQHLLESQELTVFKQKNCDEGIAKIELKIVKDIRKRMADASSSDNSSAKRRKLDEIKLELVNHIIFGERVERNYSGLKKCVICDDETVEAAYIIPQDSGCAMLLSDKNCYNRKDGLYDVRNGFLLCTEHHRGFDAHFKMTDFRNNSNVHTFQERAFTIMEKERRYFVSLAI